MRNRTPGLRAGAVAAAAATTLALGASAGLPTHAATVPANGLATGGLATGHDSARAPRAVAPKTPIRHVVVLFDENISFDHYFATYPQARNTGGTPFHALPRTPTVNNLRSTHLLTHNPNQYQPFRLGPQQVSTCDQGHSYGAEQRAFNGGKMNRFVQEVSSDKCTGLYGAPGLTMGYYDGNTVTGLWNYAQHFALNDHSFSSTFGPSTPGALNLVSGQTHGFVEVDPATGTQVPAPGSSAVVSPDANGVGTVINDPDPAYDDCSDGSHQSSNTLVQGQGRNVGDLLNAKKVTWGWFQGGFKPTAPASATRPYAVCGAKHTNHAGASVSDYSPHHSPFQYYESTSNPHHLAPTSVAAIGHTDRANHQYDLTDFTKAVKAGNLPAVSFLKPPSYQDGHAGYSDPIDEQHFLVKYINLIQTSKFWKNTAIVVAYDDSDGWYDHLPAKLLSSSHDSTNDAAFCASSHAPVTGGYADRCGPGTRQPLLVISPYARGNFVSHRPTEQTSIIRFIENNWSLGRIGDHSFDARAGLLSPMFDFKHRRNLTVLLRPNGSIRRIGTIPGVH